MTSHHPATHPAPGHHAPLLQHACALSTPPTTPSPRPRSGPGADRSDALPIRVRGGARVAVCPIASRWAGRAAAAGRSGQGQCGAGAQPGPRGHLSSPLRSPGAGPGPGWRWRRGPCGPGPAQVRAPQRGEGPCRPPRGEPPPRALAARRAGSCGRAGAGLGWAGLGGGRLRPARGPCAAAAAEPEAGSQDGAEPPAARRRPPCWERG